MKEKELLALEEKLDARERVSSNNPSSPFYRLVKNLTHNSYFTMCFLFYFIYVYIYILCIKGHLLECVILCRINMF